MNVESEIAHYRATEDNDLKYMALKEELSPLDVCDHLHSYVDQLLIPILMEESDAEIVNLVSLQVFPNVVEICLINGKSGSWFDDIVVKPLIQHMTTSRATIALQTLKSVSRKISEHNIRLGTHPYLIEEFLQKCDDTVLSIETLYYLIQCYYDFHHGIPPSILREIIKLTRNGLQGGITRLLIRETVGRANLDAITKTAVQMNLQELEVASERWWKLAPIAVEIFHSKLLPSLSISETRASSLQILLNFEPFYTVRRIDGNTLLGPRDKKLLYESLSGLNQELISISLESPDKSSSQEADSDSDSDPAQAAYLAELPSDEEIEFENEAEEPKESLPKDKSIHEVCLEILAKLTANPNATYEPLPSIIKELSKGQDEDLSFLLKLQTALETLSQLASAKPPPNLPWSQICQDLVFPRIVYDKAFVQKLKAGNLTQSIDEGATLRASAQTALQQLLPLLDFRTICMALEYELKNGIQDRDPGVKQLAAELVHSLLAAHYTEIIGLQWDWYTNLFSEEESRDLTAQPLRTSLGNDYPIIG